MVSVEVSKRRVWEGVSQGAAQAAAAAARLAAAARPEHCLKVWVGGLPKEVDDGAARAVFGACGELASVRVCVHCFFVLLLPIFYHVR